MENINYNKFRVEVKVGFKHLRPDYGPEAYNMEFKSIIIPFGKNQRFKTGHNAMKWALSYANTVASYAAKVSIIKWRGYVGYITDIKQ